MKTNRVIHVVPSLSNGGAERVALLIATHQTKHFEVHLITWLNDKEELRNPAIFHHRLAGKGKGIQKFFSLAKEMRVLFNSLEPLTIFSHLSYTNVLVDFASWGKKYRDLIWYVHHSTAFLESKLETFFVRRVYRRGKLIAVSQDTAIFLRQHGARSVYVIPNPLNLPKVATGLPQWDESQPLKIVAVGRISPEKNYGLMLASMMKMRVPYELAVFGSGDSGQYSESLRNLNIDAHVEFRGNVDFQELCSSLAASHVFLMTSDFEGEPSSLLEAAALGLPVVGRKTPGLGSAVQKVGGFLPEDDKDPDSIVSAIIRAARQGGNHKLRHEWAGVHDEDFASHSYCELIHIEFASPHN